jgi:hypothetical protein
MRSYFTYQKSLPATIGAARVRWKERKGIMTDLKETVLYGKDENIAWINFNRTEALNALNAEVVRRQTKWEF